MINVTEHIAERALYWAQRAAGTNEVWRLRGITGGWVDISNAREPGWAPEYLYETKPRTVKYWMVMLRYNKQGAFSAHLFDSTKDASDYAIRHNCTIIGNIEEREVEVRQ